MQGGLQRLAPEAYRLTFGKTLNFKRGHGSPLPRQAGHCENLVADECSIAGLEKFGNWVIENQQQTLSL